MSEETEIADITNPPEEQIAITQLERGCKVIENYLSQLPLTPGVYRMLNSSGEVLYVGKSKALKKRVTSYTQPNRSSIRIQRMVAETYSMEFVTTRTEAEALLLEANLIKRYKPRYNIRLIDDKSFPYILIRTEDEYPLALKHRGARKDKGSYYGPFASAGSVNQTLTTLQKIFQLRNCSDTIFNTRSRPCQQYQIKRCSAPCVQRISPVDYRKSVIQAQDYLSGKSIKIQKQLAHEMLIASKDLDFEKAALIRDRIRALTQLQTKQDIHIPSRENCDAIAIHKSGQNSCIQVFFFRQGSHYGNHVFFPRHTQEDSIPDILSAFLSQFYENKPLPNKILINDDVSERAILTLAFELKAGRKVTIVQPQRGSGRKMLEQAQLNAEHALNRKLAEKENLRSLLSKLGELAQLSSPPDRIEVYDNSHTQGSDAIGAMIVAGRDGFLKSQYRKFNIKTAQSNDDFAMMEEVVSRRFLRLKKDRPHLFNSTADQDEHQRLSWPQLIIIDGGRGQVNIVEQTLKQLNLHEHIKIMGVAKGQDRDAGRERIVLPNQPSFLLETDNPVLYYIQRLRDESHRYAITSHRIKRSNSRLQSALDEVPGIGRNRKKALLMHFGSTSAIKEAPLSDLIAAPGINHSTAQAIYNFFRPEEN